MNRRAFSPPFFIVCAAIILVCTAALMFTKGEKAKTALVYKDNTLLKTLSLNEDTRFDINGKYKLTITVKNGEIFVSESNLESFRHTYNKNQAKKKVIYNYIDSKKVLEKAKEFEPEEFTTPEVEVQVARFVKSLTKEQNRQRNNR